MKKNLQKRLLKFGMMLVSTRFGVNGDWIVVCNDGSQSAFPTLSQVRHLVETLENGEKK